VRRAAALSALGAALTLAALLVLASCRAPWGGQAGASAGKKVACYECHIDFKGEPLAAVHARAGVTCVRCHGTSQPHMNDEVRKTPPDAIFRGAAMQVFCLTCHDPAKHAAVEQHAAERARVAAGGKPRSCTTCHGEHKLVHLE